MTEIDELESFFRKINELKHKERSGWRDMGLEKPRDTIASHSFGSALIGWAVAEERNMDVEKVLKTLLVHDLIMSEIPDYTPADEGFENKKQLERKNMKDLLQALPESIREEIKELIDELHLQETELSKFSKEIDKLETLLQAKTYSKKLEENHLKEFLNSYKKYFETDQGKEAFRAN